MSDEGISIREYARRRGVSDTAVRKAIKAGRVRPLPNGRIDQASADRDWHSNTDPAFQRGAQVDRPEPVATPDPARQADVIPLRIVPSAPIPLLDAIAARKQDKARLAASDTPTTLVDIRAEHEKEKLRERKQKNDVREGLLVEKAASDRHVYTVVSLVRDTFQNRPDRASASLAAKYELDENTVSRLLKEFVHDTLADLVKEKKS